MALSIQPLTQIPTRLSTRSPCKRTAKFWWVASSSDPTAWVGSREVVLPASMPRLERPIRSTRTRVARSIQSRCNRTARFWRAADSRPSADKRAIISSALILPPGWRIRLTRMRAISFARSQCSRTVRLSLAAISTERTASADRPGTSWRGSMPSRAWQTHSTRTRTVPSLQSRGRRTAKYWRAAISMGRTESVERRAIILPGSMPPRDWLIRLTPMPPGPPSLQSPCRRTAESWRAANSPASADSPATTLPGSTPPRDWLIHSTRT